MSKLYALLLPQNAPQFYISFPKLTNTAARFYLQAQAYRLAQPLTNAPIDYNEVPLSVIWVCLFFEDIFEFQSVTGMILVVGSGLNIFGSKNKQVIIKHI